MDPWFGFPVDGLCWMADNGALADEKTAEEPRIVAQ
jgi:hypothetical protein